MLVKKWMTKKIIPIDANESLKNAISIFKDNRVGILPVMKEGKFTGIMTDQGLQRFLSSKGLANDFANSLFSSPKIKIKDLMIHNPATIPPDFSVEEAAALLLSNDLYGTAVLNHEGNIEGMITQPDLLKVLISLTGGEMEGVQFAFLLTDMPGSIKEVTDIIRAYGGRIASILSSKNSDSYRMLRYAYIRVYGIDNYKLNSLKTALGKKAVILYIIDHQVNKREIYSDELL